MDPMISNRSLNSSRDPDPREDPKSRTPQLWIQYPYGVDFRTLRWILLYGPQQLPILWPHIPNIAVVSDTNGIAEP